MRFTEELKKRKATAKERELLNELKKLMGGVDPITRILKVYKESWIDKLRDSLRDSLRETGEYWIMLPLKETRRTSL